MNGNTINSLGRVFLDTSTLQTLQDYGEYIYDGGVIPINNSIWSIPDGVENVEALRQIMEVGQRGNLELAISHNSLQEVMDRGKTDFLHWALEIQIYWRECVAGYADNSSVFTGRGIELSSMLDEKRFGYLSAKDAILIRDWDIMSSEKEGMKLCR